MTQGLRGETEFDYDSKKDKEIFFCDGAVPAKAYS